MRSPDPHTGSVREFVGLHFGIEYRTYTPTSEGVGFGDNMRQAVPILKSAHMSDKLLVEIFRLEYLSTLVEAALIAHTVRHLHGATVRACYEMSNPKLAVDRVTAPRTCL